MFFNISAVEFWKLLNRASYNRNTKSYDSLEYLEINAENGILSAITARFNRKGVLQSYLKVKTLNYESRNAGRAVISINTKKIKEFKELKAESNSMTVYTDETYMYILNGVSEIKFKLVRDIHIREPNEKINLRLTVDKNELNNCLKQLASVTTQFADLDYYVFNLDHKRVEMTNGIVAVCCGLENARCVTGGEIYLHKDIKDCLNWCLSGPIKCRVHIYTGKFFNKVCSDNFDLYIRQCRSKIPHIRKFECSLASAPSS